MAYQNLDAFLSEVWGWGPESSAALVLTGLASNVAIGGNPPYTVTDFLVHHPQFAGQPTIISGALDGSTGIVTDLSSVSGLAAGQLVAGPGTQDGSIVQSVSIPPLQVTATLEIGNINITVNKADGILNGAPVIGANVPDATVVLNIAGNTLTISNAPTANGFLVPLQIGANPSMTLSLPTTQAGTVQLNVYTKPLIPAVVLKSYINLASKSIQSARWCELWHVAMGLYIAHYCTLFLKAFAQGPGSTAGQVASAGLAIGIQTSKSAGDVSVGIGVMTGIEDWGTYQLTLYGQQFATFAKSIGSGGMLLL